MQNAAKSVSTTIAATIVAETTIVPADPAGRNQLVGLVITTPNAAAGTITIKDSTGGTARFVIDYPNAATAPGAPCVIDFKWPVMQQAGLNNNWTATPSANASGIHISALYVPEY